MAPIVTAPLQLTSIRFTDLTQLNAWTSRGSRTDRFLIAREQLSHHKRFKPTSSDSAHDTKVIVCHDYKGNYVNTEDDSPVGYFPHDEGMHYFLQYPSLVDIFIYFSHNLISVPPVSWTNALHRNGVSSLGTIMFEKREDQSQLDEFVERDEDGSFKYVKVLVDLCEHYGFDGWLINVECPFLDSLKALDLTTFVDALRSQLHVRIPESKVIWYDALIAPINKVSYQNGVNENNYDHFDSSDLFFTNYWWDEATLKKNILNVGLQGIRKKLFVGIDVWGRGTSVGHGGFETGLAMKLIRLYSSNIALFAPAWTYENFDKGDFVLNDQQFWIDEIHDEHYPNGSVNSYVEHFTTPIYVNGKDVVFYSNFSQGEGDGYYVNGKKVYFKKWVHVGLQQATPQSLKYKQLEVTKVDGYNGGSSLKVIIQKDVEYSHRTNIIDLFKFKSDITSRNMRISLSFRHLDERVRRDICPTLEITYYIERRFRTIMKIREGVLKVPFSTGFGWNNIETSFSLPHLREREHFVLSGARINWIPKSPTVQKEVGNANSNNNDSESSDKSWIFVSGPNDLSVVYEILIGDILIEGTENIREVSAVTKLGKEDLNTGEVLVSWPDNEFVSHWLVFINAEFVGVACTNYWILKRRDRIRVDCISKAGKVIEGQDLVV